MGAGLAATEPLQSSALTEQEQDEVGGEVEWLVLPLPGLAQSVKGRAEGQSRGSGTPRLALRRGCGVLREPLVRRIFIITKKHTVIIWIVVN